MNLKKEIIVIFHKLKKLEVSNNNIFIIFNLAFFLFITYTVSQYTLALDEIDFYDFLFGDGEYHIQLIHLLHDRFALQDNLPFAKIHHSGFYFNNYYVFSNLVLFFLKKLPGFDYSFYGLSAITINLISIYLISIAGYLISLKFSKSKIFSLSLILLLWNEDLIIFSLRIYPDILQLTFIFLAIYFATLNNKFYWFLSFVICGLAFGVKLQGLLIFIFLISLFILSQIKFSYYNFKSFLTINRQCILESLLFVCSFFFTFYVFNQIDPTQLFLPLSSSLDLSQHEFDNSQRLFEFFNYILRGKMNLAIIVVCLLLCLIIDVKQKNKNLLILCTLFFVIFFYLILLNLNFLIQGPRYLYHILPLLIILISYSYEKISTSLVKWRKKNYSVIFSIFFFIYGSLIFQSTFLNSIETINFKNILKTHPAMEGVNFFKNNITKKKENPYTCAGKYSVIPSSFSNSVDKSYVILDFKELIEKKKCDYLVLDKKTHGKFIWFKQEISNLIIKEYDNLSDYNKNYGKETIKNSQSLIKDILLNPKSFYEIIFYNNELIILSLKQSYFDIN